VFLEGSFLGVSCVAMDVGVRLALGAIYVLRGTPAKFVGIVDDQPDADSAIKQAIEEYNVALNGRLMAQRRD
jgi:hypothetical protein